MKISAPIPYSPINSRSPITRFRPEPKSSFLGILRNTAAGAFSLAMGGAPGIEGTFSELLQQQLYWQYQMQLVSLYSNAEKSRHETAMAAVRNIRVG